MRNRVDRQLFRRLPAVQIFVPRHTHTDKVAGTTGERGFKRFGRDGEAERERKREREREKECV